MLLFSGEFDHVDYKGKQTKCRSACEDQVITDFSYGPMVPWDHAGIESEAAKVELMT